MCVCALSYAFGNLQLWSVLKGSLCFSVYLTECFTPFHWWEFSDFQWWMTILCYSHSSNCTFCTFCTLCHRMRPIPQTDARWNSKLSISFFYWTRVVVWLALESFSEWTRNHNKTIVMEDSALSRNWRNSNKQKVATDYVKVLHLTAIMD